VAQGPGPSTDIAAVKTWTGGTCHLGPSVGETNFQNGFHARTGIISSEPQNEVVYASGNTNGFTSTLGGAVVIPNSISSGNTYTGFYAVVGAVLSAASTISTGNLYGYQSSQNSTIFAVSSTSSGDGTDYSPAINTESANFGVIIK